MMFLVLNRCALSTSRPGLARVKSGRNWNKRDVLKEKIKERIARLRSEMAETSVEQKSIVEGQKQVLKKTEEIQRESEQLRKETKLLSQQNNDIRERLNLIFQILKARVESDSAKVAQLTRSLRDLMIAKPNPK
ncbi:uncharacterized protein LOC119990049 isoform X2 [Tripterygium wilfordii]|uniref:uncharacterized protein LOC119990049 isoform X2 n=1 Tax=Tripterygium wilfordii TaxID=458696 RepID=UPI0018F85DBB|nr:uncharacterized protein LOC119990049 isoform X2 [Tripterygium wilfordii]